MKEEVEEEVVESEEKEKGEYELTLDIEDLAVREALKDILAVNEEIPKEPPIKSPTLQKFIEFKNECEALMELLKPYAQEDEIDILSEDFDLKKAVALVKKLAGIDGRKEEEYIEGEPSAYAQELFREVWQKYIDCKWFFAMIRGRRPVTPKELRYLPAPKELVEAVGERI
jgi:hypothetical protein